LLHRSLDGNVSKESWNKMTVQVGAGQEWLSMLVCKRSAACGSIMRRFCASLISRTSMHFILMLSQNAVVYYHNHMLVR
jgi:hypothetical protein